VDHYSVLKVYNFNISSALNKSLQQNIGSYNFTNMLRISHLTSSSAVNELSKVFKLCYKLLYIAAKSKAKHDETTLVL